MRLRSVAAGTKYLFPADSAKRISILSQLEKSVNEEWDLYLKYENDRHVGKGTSGRPIMLLDGISDIRISVSD